MGTDTRRAGTGVLESRRASLAQLLPGSDAHAGPLASATLRAGTLVALAAAFGQSVVHLANVVLLDRRLGVLDVDADAGVFTWASATATVLAIPALALLAAAEPGRRQRLTLLALAAILALLSLDDAVAIHEKLAEVDVALGLGENGGRLIWPVIYLPLLACAALIAMRLARNAPRATGRLIAAALGLLGLAVCMEFGSYALVMLGLEMRDWPFVIEITIEEGLELAGWLLLATALTALAADRLAGPRPDDAP